MGMPISSTALDFSQIKQCQMLLLITSKGLYYEGHVSCSCMDTIMKACSLMTSALGLVVSSHSLATEVCHPYNKNCHLRP